MERYSREYLLELIPLHKKRVELERAEEDARINRESQFPTNADEYHNMSSRAAQLHVARFLMADVDTRQRISSGSRWPSGQTQALIQEYQTNVCDLSPSPQVSLKVYFSL